MSDLVDEIKERLAPVICGEILARLDDVDTFLEQIDALPSA